VAEVLDGLLGLPVTPAAVDAQCAPGDALGCLHRPAYQEVIQPDRMRSVEVCESILLFIFSN
jgi:hypothetical protein